MKKENNEIRIAGECILDKDVIERIKEDIRKEVINEITEEGFRNSDEVLILFKKLGVQRKMGLIKEMLDTIDNSIKTETYREDKSLDILLLLKKELYWMDICI